MITFLILVFVPTLIAVAALLFFKEEVTWKEFSLQLGVCFLLAALGAFAAYEGRVRDTELWNGQITDKRMERVSCSHSYSCNCRTVSSGSGKNTTYSTVCDTCYEHAYDQDWALYASTGERVTVSREDRQGLEEPERWSRAYIGEPFTSEHSFTNYILANPTNVLNSGTSVDKFTGLIPLYPAVYDIYRADHFILAGSFPDFDKKDWSYLVNQANKRLGPDKQVNLIVIVVNTTDHDYYWALKNAWMGGKKNDAIVIIGSADGHKIDWADVLSWSPREDYKVELRDSILAIGSLDQRDAIVHQIEIFTQSKFERLHMKKMRYLVASYEMPMQQKVIVIIIVSVIELGLAWWSIREDIF